MSKNILITGGTGTIGANIVRLLTNEGHAVRVLTRKKSPNAANFYSWDPNKGELPPQALEGIDIVLHLAGAGIGDKKWSADRKKEIVDSRVKSAQLLYDTIAKMDIKPSSFISASAIGYYGYDTGSILVKETSRFGDDFLATVVKAWEGAADQFEQLGMRVVKLRFGVVLSSSGGALAKMETPIKMGVGAGLGRGDQYISWIHQDDVSACIAHFVAQDLSGVFNVVSPQPVTNKAFMKTLAKTLKKPFFLPNVPGFVLKIMLGQQASLVLGGNRVSSESLQNSGFSFAYPSLDEALQNLYNK